MMIDVHNLTKRYPRTTAVDAISFQVNEREIVGILGPNGAGKTTTMQVLAGYLPPTSGVINVAGHDVLSESLAVRSRIGYLPESVPLYTDMRVNEYLAYRGRLKGLHGRRLRGRTGAVLEMCGLVEARRNVIGRLSRGFRQRVGLADTLLAEPPLLILDEPTVGLDPNQIRQIRNLIKSLADRHTVLMASHILPEVEMVCQRVLIMNKGRLVVSDSPENLVGLLRGNGRVVMEVRGGLAETITERLESLPPVLRVRCTTANEWVQVVCECEKGRDIRADLFRVVATNGWTLREMREERGNLEDVFREVTSELQ